MFYFFIMNIGEAGKYIVGSRRGYRADTIASPLPFQPILNKLPNWNIFPNYLNDRSLYAVLMWVRKEVAVLSVELPTDFDLFWEFTECWDQRRELVLDALTLNGWSKIIHQNAYVGIYFLYLLYLLPHLRKASKIYWFLHDLWFSRKHLDMEKISNPCWNNSWRIQNKDKLSFGLEWLLNNSRELE